MSGILGAVAAVGVVVVVCCLLFGVLVSKRFVAVVGILVALGLLYLIAWAGYTGDFWGVS